MMEKSNLLDKLSELKNRKNELITNMNNSSAKNGVDSIIEIILNSIK